MVIFVVSLILSKSFLMLFAFDNIIIPHFFDFVKCIWKNNFIFLILTISWKCGIIYM
nr:MAG TPA: hypothetical protein [Caudoviricetes sp.]